MKKLPAEEKSPQVQHAVNGDSERPLTPTENAAAVSPFRTRPRSRTGLPGHDGENRACIHHLTAVCRSVCDVEEMTRRTAEITSWQPSFLAKSNLLPIADLLAESGEVETHGCLVTGALVLATAAEINATLLVLLLLL
jgi:hypothetical protein